MLWKIVAKQVVTQDSRLYLNSVNIKTCLCVAYLSVVKLPATLNVEVVIKKTYVIEIKEYSYIRKRIRNVISVTSLVQSLLYCRRVKGYVISKLFFLLLYCSKLQGFWALNRKAYKNICWWRRKVYCSKFCIQSLFIQ